MHLIATVRPLRPEVVTALLHRFPTHGLIPIVLRHVPVVTGTPTTVQHAPGVLPTPFKCAMSKPCIADFGIVHEKKVAAR